MHAHGIDHVQERHETSAAAQGRTCASAAASAREVRPEQATEHNLAATGAPAVTTDRLGVKPRLRTGSASRRRRHHTPRPLKATLAARRRRLRLHRKKG
uniref:Uncharacterized protein n=1 Tax=Oryza nivara TaxID=4536 RepID=A0A0E0GZL9_ORYNI